MEEKKINEFCMYMHLSQLASFLIPLAGTVAPIVMWSMKKAESPVIDAHGKEIINFQLSLLIYAVICLILMVVLIGMLLLPLLGIFAIVMPIIAGVKANNGEAYKYPLTIHFLK